MNLAVAVSFVGRFYSFQQSSIAKVNARRSFASGELLARPMRKGMATTTAEATPMMQSQRLAFDGRAPHCGQADAFELTL